MSRAIFFSSRINSKPIISGSSTVLFIRTGEHPRQIGFYSYIIFNQQLIFKIKKNDWESVCKTPSHFLSESLIYTDSITLIPIILLTFPISIYLAFAIHPVLFSLFHRRINNQIIRLLT